MRYVETASGPVEAHLRGEGERTVVLLHPLAMSGAVWNPWAAELAARGHRVVAPTLPAGRPEEIGERTSVPAMAAQTAALLDALDVQSASVAGLSMGGCVALQLALDRPDLVDSLVLADTSSDYGPERVQNWEARAQLAATSPREDLLDFQTTRWFTEGFAAADPVEHDRLLGIFVRTPSSVHAASCRALGDFTCATRLAEIDRPALVLVGEEDFATPLEMAEVIAKGVPGAWLEILDGVRHFSLLESPEARGLAEHFLAL